MRISTRLYFVVLSLFALLVGLSALVGVEAAHAHSGGPNDGLTGAPGESNCTQCHTSFPLDSGEGLFAETCLVAEYAPGDTYTICLSLSDPEAMRWGFEITMLDADGNSVGNLSAMDANTQITVGGAFDRQYAKHTAAGTAPGQAVGQNWALSWDAPPAGTGTVTLYGMGNAANNNNSTSGDHIYSLQIVLEEATETGAQDLPLFAQLQPNFPNPFNPKTTVGFSLDQGSSVELAIFDSSGKRVRTLHQGYVGAGSHSRVWDGRDETGRPSASGIYLARLLGAEGRDLDQSRKLVLTK